MSYVVPCTFYHTTRFPVLLWLLLSLNQSANVSVTRLQHLTWPQSRCNSTSRCSVNEHNMSCHDILLTSFASRNKCYGLLTATSLRHFGLYASSQFRQLPSAWQTNFQFHKKRNKYIIYLKQNQNKCLHTIYSPQCPLKFRSYLGRCFLLLCAWTCRG